MTDAPAGPMGYEPGTVATIETTSADYLRAMWTTANVWVGIDGENYHPASVLYVTDVVHPDVLTAFVRVIDRIEENR